MDYIQYKIPQDALHNIYPMFVEPTIDYKNIRSYMC